ncbi:tol-pal system-associated acyl-CoA thioesterase [Paradevosia shaoguanensis]|uniref:tol-pal system-associated acyl-CoA thioesterase n=1 Tax=Paradevosia shaoguanensis TaxID=1335043 RepID=UPI002490AD19|nr:tol-pal system-associated acyl-CoA thioesterase [Paradevosia shaoguanensis]
MTPHHLAVRVYYEDTDFSGNVYHASYLKFFERGRTEFLRDLGIHHSELAEQGIAFAVRSMQIEFEGAAHIDDLLDVETSVANFSGVRLMLEQVIRRGDEVLTRATVVVVSIKVGGGAARPPRLMLAALKS